ncbi:MAG: DUF1566 domain-containing protein [Gammaproteobacteria bacterium]|nr:DUF1566 domain-containing protein [Gammaproteobacteria bacterium]
MRPIVKVIAILGLALGGAIAAHSAELICSSSSNVRASHQSTPSARFVINTSNASVAIDKLTGMMWERCSLGFTFQANAAGVAHCVDSGTTNRFSWRDALSAAQAIRDQASAVVPVLHNRYGDWRVPTMKELSTIIEFQCWDPSVNLSVFPDTQAGPYWTSTPAEDAVAIVAHVVDFFSGGISIQNSAPQSSLNINQLSYVRLVRTCKAEVDCPGMPTAQ